MITEFKKRPRPCKGWKSHWKKIYFKSSAELATRIMLVSFLAYTSTLKKEAPCSSKRYVSYSNDYMALYPRRYGSS
jgi:hypothetical protein